MPELIEVELYRGALDPLIGKTIESIAVRHAGFVRPLGSSIEEFQLIVGGRLESTTRVGKVLLLHVLAEGDRLVVGLRFGMTGRLVIDGTGPIDQLEYSSSRNDPEWDRVRIQIGGAVVALRDQRRLGSIELNPDVSALGHDAASLRDFELVDTLRSRTKSIKSVLLDQDLVAGLGNLLVDEVLWRAAVDPRRGADTFADEEAAVLAVTVTATVSELSRRGGSHTGDTFSHRTAGALCPRCGDVMRSDVVGGRTTWWCAGHQR